VEPRRLLLDEPGARAERGRLGPVAQLELLQDLPDMQLDRDLCEIELTPDLLVRQADGQALHDIELTAGEGGQRLVELARAAVEGALLLSRGGSIAHQRGQDVGRQIGSTG